MFRGTLPCLDFKKTTLWRTGNTPTKESHAQEEEIPFGTATAHSRGKSGAVFYYIVITFQKFRVFVSTPFVKTKTKIKKIKKKRQKKKKKRKRLWLISLW